MVRRFATACSINMFERPHQILQSRLDIRIALLGQTFTGALRGKR